MSRRAVHDFVVDLSRVGDVQINKEKIEKLFDVVVNFGNVAHDESNRERQWVELKGELDDRRNAKCLFDGEENCPFCLLRMIRDKLALRLRNAEEQFECFGDKEYIIALCHPDDIIPMKCPVRLLNDSGVELEKVEAQTHAAISVKSDSEINIAGTDLAVTLAMSAIEDLIERCREVEQTDSPAAVHEDVEKARKEKRLSSEAAVRLDTRFERALSQHSDGTCTSKDYEHAPDSVKRVMLQCWSEDTGHGLDYTLLPGEDVPDVVSTQNDEPRNTHTSAANSSSIAHKPPTYMTNLGNQVNEISLESNSNTAAKEKPDQPDSEGLSAVFPLRQFARQCGYPDEQIDAVLKPGMLPKDLLAELYKNKTLQQTTQQSDSLLFSDGAQCSNEDRFTSNSEVIQSKSEKFDADRRRSSSEVFCSKEAVMGSPITAVDSYFQRLARDFQEEDNCTDISEFKQRNAERRKILKPDTVPTTQRSSESQSVTDPGPLSAKSPSHRKRNKGKKNKGKGSASPSPNYTGDDVQNSERQTSPKFLIDLTSEESGHVDSQSNEDFQVDLTNGANGRAASQSSQVSGDFNETSVMKVWQPNSMGAWQNHQGGHLARGAAPYQQMTGSRGKHCVPVEQQLRHIIIDGSNVAMSHGNGKVFSCAGIKVCVDYFLRRGHTEVTAFVPQWRQRIPTPSYPIQQQELLEQLKDQGHLVFTPARKLDGKHIVCYDDRFVLKLAEQTDGVIVSNDNYRDLMKENPVWKKMIHDRLLMYTFVGDFFMPPDDPLGKDGPTLDEYLSKNYQPMTKKTRALPPQPLMSITGLARPNYRHPNPMYHQQYNMQNFQHGLYQQQQQQQQQPRPRQTWNPKRNKGPPGRSPEETDHLATLLRNLFPNKDQEEKIHKVLQNHRSEKDVNKLSNYIMNICS